MSETLKRFITGIIIGGISIWIIYEGGWIWALYCTLIALICQQEFFYMMAAKGYHVRRLIPSVVSAGLILIAHVAGIEFAAGLLTVGILAMLIVQLNRPIISQALMTASVSIASVVYVGWLITHAIYVRNLVTVHGQAVGLFAIIYVLFCVSMNDTGAYFVGRKWGKHKIAPNISPKKTWEGVIGGVLASMLTGILMKWFWEKWIEPVPYSYVHLTILAAFLGIVGFFGDLVESMLKRDAEVKDSGTLLPGHGGVLDRIDGGLFAVPFAYYAFLLFERLRGPLP